MDERIPDKVITRCNTHRYHTRKTITEEIRLSVFKYDDYTCVYCGVKVKSPHCDHITPVVKFGNNTAMNLATACKSCNLEKGVKSIDEWLIPWAKKRRLTSRSEIFRLFGPKSKSAKLHAEKYLSNKR